MWTVDEWDARRWVTLGVLTNIDGKERRAAHLLCCPLHDPPCTATLLWSAYSRRTMLSCLPSPIADPT